MPELVHVKSYRQAEAFRDHFHRCIQPGVMEGKELAEEEARLESFSDEWQPLEGEHLQQYLDPDLRLTRERHEWRAWNPDAERDRRFEAGEPPNDPVLAQIEDDIGF